MIRYLLHATLVSMLIHGTVLQTSGTAESPRAGNVLPSGSAWTGMPEDTPRFPPALLGMLAEDLGTRPELAEDLQALNYAAIADYYNASDPEGFWVWRSRVAPEEYLGPHGIDLHEVPSVEESRLRPFVWLTGGLTRALDARDIRIRDAIALAFRQRSRTNLQILCRRLATRWERLRAEGTGSMNAPGVVTDETPLTVGDIAAAVKRMQGAQP